MTHLHLPDGVLPWWLWAPGIVLAGLIVFFVARHHRHDRRDRLALLGTLSALMLAAMSMELGPLGYHLSLAPVVGILLGGGLAFLAGCVVNAILALLGHGGFTVVGINALITGATAALCGAVYRHTMRRAAPFWAAAWAAVVGMVVAEIAWLVVVAIAGAAPNPGHAAVAGHAHAELPWSLASLPPEFWTRLGRFALLSSPFLVLGTFAEALVAGSVVAFLARTSPAMLPGRRAAEPAVAPAASPRPAEEPR